MANLFLSVFLLFAFFYDNVIAIRCICTDTNKNSQINDSEYTQSETSQLINCEFFTHSYIRNKIGSCLLWVMSTEISVDIAVDTRSIVGRHSVDSRSTLGRQSVDTQSTLGRHSVDSRSI